MATFVWCELVCDYCSEACVGEFTSTDKIPRKYLKEQAKLRGWVFDKENPFLLRKPQKRILEK